MTEEYKYIPGWDEIFCNRYQYKGKEVAVLLVDKDNGKKLYAIKGTLALKGDTEYSRYEVTHHEPGTEDVDYENEEVH